ncbi:hypothetical protein KQI65_17785 [bacterium]|nr:hypothetical protein [bacterium]
MIDQKVLEHMHEHISQWSACADDRSIFLQCYSMMTANTLKEIELGGFRDGPWVESLLNRFAEYYFNALDAYELHDGSAPAVWQHAHDITIMPGTLPVQHLLLGVNAHINYDLVLTVTELLREEGEETDSDQLAIRYQDYAHVNTIIANTIDAVQDTILNPSMLSMRVLDTIMGRMDEALIARSLRSWRERVWVTAIALLHAPSERVYQDEVKRLETHVMQLALAISEKRWRALIGR